MKNNKDHGELVKRLNVLIWLFVELLKRDEKKIPLSILSSKLKKLGLTNEDISVFIDKTPNQVAKIAYEIKRKKSGGKGGDYGASKK